jgi:hypothetical protein
LQWSHIFKLRNHNLFVKVQFWKKLTIRTEGIESRVKRTPFHCIFLDYDNITFETLIEDELKPLQEWFDIGNFYVFQTGDLSYHCICIDALTAKETHTIVNASGCDQAFKKAVLINEHRNWVLRFTEKGYKLPPKYICKVESGYEGMNPQSVGHAIYLKKFGIEIELKLPVGDSRIGTEGYSTSDEHMRSKGRISNEGK